VAIAFLNLGKLELSTTRHRLPSPSVFGMLTETADPGAGFKRDKPVLRVVIGDKGVIPRS
jgi:hypothetical protein